MVNMQLQGVLVPCERNNGRCKTMPKMKTRKSAAKRYRVTGTGKVRFKKQGLRHILTKKSSKRKANLRATGILADMEAKRAKSMLPYA
jgi:large subunit ribosomal protein L35